MRFSEINVPIDNREPSFSCLNDCSQFINESGGIPLLKYLPTSYKDVHRVKVRLQRNNSNDFQETFNEAFRQKKQDLRQRAIFAHSEISLIQEDKTTEPFFVFPINGYKFMFCKEVKNSEESFKKSFDSICEAFTEDKAKQVVKDLLSMTYTEHNLHEGIESGAEVVLYGIPYYYAIRKSSIGSYEKIMEKYNATI